MTTRAAEQFDEWESSPFRDGYRGLHDLADSGFSGVVTAGNAKLCMLNGTAVGILDGDIDDFEESSGTAYKAPSPALPLLALMQERSEEVRGQYYSEDTPLSEVDDTLSDGGFTGFIELSENVLSGDYYVVYHRGRSMAVAWVGNSGQLLTEDEAFERADDEVGIFAVHPAELDPVEIPEVDDGPDAAAAGVESDDDAGATDTSPDSAPTAAEGDGPAPNDGETDPTAEAEPDDGGTVDADPTGSESGPDETTARAVDERDRGGADTDDGVGEVTASAEGDASEGADEPVDEPTTDRRETTGRRDSADRRDTADGTEPAAGARDREQSSTAGADRADRTPERAVDRDHEPDRSSEQDTERRDRSGRSDRRDRSDRAEGRTDAGGDPPRGRESDARTDREPDSHADGEPDARTDRESGAGRGRSAPRDRRQSRDPAEGRATDSRTTDAHTTDARPGGSNREGVRDRSGATADSPTPTAESGGRPEATSESGRGSDDGASTPASGPDQLETHAIPSLDPSRTTSRESDDGGAAAATASEDPPAAGVTEPATASTAENGPEPAAAPARESDGRRTGRERERSRDGEPRDQASEPSSEPRTSEPEPGRTDGRVADLEDELAEREAEIDRLEADLAAAESERDDLRSQLDEVRAERDDLQSRIERVEDERDRLERERDDLESEVSGLESEVERLEDQLADIEAEFGAAVDADQRLSPGEALDQTNLFVRYGSKGKPTLETAHAGEASRQEVGENLGLEYHTQFDSESASVGGRPFDEFLRDTMQFRFVTWVINDLLYEIRDTGKVSALQELYDAIPKIDRAELNGSVSTEYTEDGQERRNQESFDVVMRDRMGNALLTANMNDSRQAASESMMSALVTASSHVGESTESLGASFLVTSSFFEPEALETAAEATSGGLLSRDKRESFVKLTRKQGYHLCLVEAREEKFHLAVPEL